MILAERQARILALVKASGFISVSDLCEKLDVSSATIRRDINALSDNGVILKTHGGAMDPLHGSTTDIPVNLRKSMNMEEKDRIAAEAITHIKEGDSIFLDSGTTTNEIAKKLKIFSKLTVVTHDLMIALETLQNTLNNVIAIGGSLKPETITSSGFFAERMIDDIHVDKAFIGIDAISTGNCCMCYAVSEIAVKRLMIKNSIKSILVCDHTKFENTAFVNVCQIRDFDLIITGSELDDKLCREVREETANLNCV